jgi:hypothetical protein
MQATRTYRLIPGALARMAAYNLAAGDEIDASINQSMILVEIK